MERVFFTIPSTNAQFSLLLKAVLSLAVVPKGPPFLYQTAVTSCPLCDFQYLLGLNSDLDLCTFCSHLYLDPLEV